LNEVEIDVLSVPAACWNATGSSVGRLSMSLRTVESEVLTGSNAVTRADDAVEPPSTSGLPAPFSFVIIESPVHMVGPSSIQGRWSRPDARTRTACS
jgi:hypothetical protein